MQDVLCVIDMQTGFDTTAGAEEGVIKMVKRAIRKKWHILIVELQNEYGFGDTVDSIMELVEKYGNWTLVEKEYNDGSNEIMDALPSDFDGNLHVCGINYEFCVNETVQGLCYLTTPNKIHLYVQACNCAFPKGAETWVWRTNYHKSRGVVIKNR